MVLTHRLKISGFHLIIMNACLECATKHVTMALVQYDEYIQCPEDNSTDLINCIGNLACAEMHLVDEHPELSQACREIRKTIMANNRVEKNLFDEVVVGICGAAGLFNQNDNKSLDKNAHL